ncbi:MAG: UDP-2,3-diacylglucosamine diphosphatase, partial [Mesorhizobium sp.]
VQYINTGDWVESCTAVVEHFDGRMEILTWAHVLPEAPAGKDVLVPVNIKGRAVQAA